jgi:ABC-2 type transport system ATP-binding protein
MSLAIEVSALSKRFGDRTAVDSVSFAVGAGSIFGLLGPNGAGKSTTLRLLCGFLAPTSGEARVAGLSPWRERAALKQAIGFMPQAFGLYDHLTVTENLEFFAELYLPSRRRVRVRTHEVIAMTGLRELAEAQVAGLSAGWRQRLALGCAMLHEPKVLFLDEPTAGVDPISRRLFWDLIHALNDRGATIFLTTHYVEEVERCHTVGLLHDGALKVCGSPIDLRASAEAAHDLVAVDCSDADRAVPRLRAEPGVVDAYLYGQRLHVTWERGGDCMARTRTLLAGAGLSVRAVEPRTATMEDVFINAAHRGSTPP